jgi:hypothetical protein
MGILVAWRVVRAWSNGLVVSGALGIALVGTLANCSGSDKPPIADNPRDASDDLPDTGHDATTVTPPMESGAPEAGGDATTPGDDAGDSGGEAGNGVDAASEAAGPCSSDNDDAGVELMMCGTHCVNVDTDNNNCGGCNQVCGTIPGTFCIIGQCSCPAPQSVCSGQCVDITDDGSNCGFCGHNCTGATCSGGLCQPGPVATTFGGGVLLATVAASIVVDSGYVYWTQSAGTGTDPGVYQQAIGGTSVAGPWASDDPRGLAFSGHTLLWADFTDETVFEGSLLAGPGAPTAIGSGSHPLAIATDGTNVYWTDVTAGTINQTPLASPGVTKVLATAQDTPVAIAVDAAYVYWIDNGTLANSGSVNRCPIGVANTVTQIAKNENLPFALALYPPFTSQTATPPAATTVYWTDKTNPGMVKSAPAGGGTATVIASGQLAPFGIAVDSQYVYWTNFDGNTVVKAPLAGGTEYVLASGLNVPTAIAVDATNVYWANQGNGTIFKVAK